MDVTKPDEFLTEMRRVAGKITDTNDAGQKLDPVLCVKLAQMFQELDQALCDGGDAPLQWTE